MMDAYIDWTNTLTRGNRFRKSLFGLLFALSCLRVHAANWLPFGPDGGDARSFAADPRDPSHLYLGTLTGWIYESRNGGRDWKRLASVGKRDDLALDSIVVDSTNPKHILVGAWVLGSPDGGMYTSHDGGVTWANEVDMRGQSVRALAASASSPNIVIAGALTGVYRSTDGESIGSSSVLREAANCMKSSLLQSTRSIRRSFM